MSTQTATQVFQYNENQVIFQIEKDGMINATELAKPFGKHKRPTFWLRTAAAKEYMEAYSDDAHICTSSLMSTVTGKGRQQGTWMHPDIAIEFARWLNPRFGIWCNLRIKELLNTGCAITEEFKEEMNSKLQTLYSEMEKVQNNYNHLLERNQELEDMVLKAKNFNSSRKALRQQRTFTVTEIAKELKMSPEELNIYLSRNLVQWKIDGFWVLRPECQGQGFAIVKHGVNGNIDTDGTYYETPYQYLVWTVKGRNMILEMYEIYE